MTHPVPELHLAAYICDRDDPNMSYVADDAEGCAAISVLCEPDWLYFETECGCGGEFTG